MKQRLKRTFACLLAVLTVYGAYAALAVPLLEPTIELASSQPGGLGPAHPPRERGFEKLFPQDSWELSQPKVLETDRGTLIFDDYIRLPDPVDEAEPNSHSRLKLTRCSMVFESGDSPENSRSIVLRAPEGAVLFFEGELNIPRGRFGRLVGGELSGEVTIYSPPTPGQDDGLEIVTRNIRIEERKIWTPHDVVFRYGPNSGAGGDLAIVMHPPAKVKEKGSSQSSVGRIKSFQLVRVDKINLQVPASKLAAPGVPKPQPTANELTPVDIKCRGALTFDFDEYVLSLNDHVDVIRHNMDGPSDQLNCQQLKIFFRKADKTAASGDMPSMGAKPRKIIAMGLPATLRAESVGGFARGEQLEFDFETNRVWIHDRNGVELRSETYHVASTEIEYELGPDGRLGRMWAAGPGHVSGLLGKDPRRFEASWQKDVRMQDFQGSKVLSLTDGARVSVEEAGEFSARELHVFLDEVPRPDNPKRFSILPNRMKALGSVAFDSPRLSGTLEEANVWFMPEPTDSLNSTASQPPLMTAAGEPTPGEAIKKLHVTAGRLNAELQLGDDPQLIRLAAQGRVHCENADRASPDKILVDCDVFQIEQGNSENPIASITGQPARVGAQGALIIGESIQVQYGANIVEMHGPGEMTLPRKKSPQHPWHLVWQRQMHFDGQRATFEGSAAARGVQFLRDGERLHFDARGRVVSAVLNKFIAFKDADDQDDVGLDELQFDGECFLYGEVFDRQGNRKSREQMQVRNLAFNQTSGKLHGDGPGWLTSVHNGKDLFKEGAFSTTPKGLHYLRVNFEGELVGNLNRRQIEFLGRVRSIYGPVTAWDQTIGANRSAEMRERDVTINSERLAVADMGQGRDHFDAIELEATGNALVRGQTFTASGQRVSYAKAKDQLILEGDGRNDAVLTFQRVPGTKPGTLNAGKILFWPDSKHFELDRFRSLELDNLSQLRRRNEQTRARSGESYRLPQRR